LAACFYINGWSISVYVYCIILKVVMV
jgi:hypothetical protein